MNYLEEIVFLIKYYSLDHSDRFYFNKDKLNLFMYLFERHKCLRDEETFTFNYILTIDMEGFLLLDSTLIQEIDCDKVMDAIQMFYTEEEVKELLVHSTQEDVNTIKRIVDKYIGMDYDSVLNLMSRIGGNVISPEMVLYTPLPYTISDRSEIKDKIKHLTK